MDAHLFVNPTSGSYADCRIDKIRSTLMATGITVTQYTVKTPKEIQGICASKHVRDAPPLTIVAAGDGTINAVLNALKPGSTTLAVLPLGTSNVLATELGINSLEDGLGRIVRGDTRPLSVGRVHLEGRSYLFALMAGIGFDGAVVRDVRDREKWILRQGAYLLSAIKNCCKWESETIEVIADRCAVTCHTAVVCNASRYGGDFVLAPETGIFLPGLVVTCVNGVHRRDSLGATFDLMRGSCDASRHLQRIICREVEIRGSKPVQIDGDFVGYGPAQVETVADVCKIIV